MSARPRKKDFIGPPEKLSGPYLLEAIKARSKECGACWEWHGPFTSGRVPMMRHRGDRRPVRALILEWKGKPARANHVASTSCENTACVNPEHTKELPKAKMLERSRKNTNQAARAAKISATQIRKLGKISDDAYMRIMGSTESGVSIGKDLGVDQSLVSAYRNGKRGRFRMANPFAGLLR